MNYACPPLSRDQLRKYANTIRRSLELSDTLKFPVERFLETFHLLINDESFYFETVADREWNQPPGRHAYYDLEGNCINIKESVYNGACDGNGRDRMTVVHECAHVLLLRHSHLTLARSFDENIPTCCDPEWQAKCLAGELMVPKELVQGMSANDVALQCGVSHKAASYQLSKF